MLPRTVSFGILITLVLSVIIWRLFRWGKQLYHFLTHRHLKINLTPPPGLMRWQPLLILAELIFITLFTLNVSRAFWEDDPTQTLKGGEVEWQVNTAYMAAHGLHTYGYIPLWTPWLEYGHPLIDNAQSFVLNPFSSLPSLLFGGVRGMKLSLGIHALLAAWGGWFLGRVLGFGALGRVLLALLLLGKGNMTANYGAGYVQLASAQAYFPWIIAGTIAILCQPGTRWAVVLTALALTLQFWGGSIWYSLPMVVAVICLGMLYLFYMDGKKINWQGLSGLIAAGLLTVGLSAMTLLPIWLHQEYIGAHPDDKNIGKTVGVENVIKQYYTGGLEEYAAKRSPGNLEFYYSFILPLWFGLLIFIVIPPLPRVFHRESQSLSWRLWLLALLMILICTLWGAGGNRAVVWLYQNAPLIGQWRFVGRALGVASFWIAVLVAMRVDGLWRAVMDWGRFPLTAYPVIWLVVQGLALGGLVYASSKAAEQVNELWDTLVHPISFDRWSDDMLCTDWILTHTDSDYRAVFRQNYEAMLPYITNEIRFTYIAADFEPLPITPTISRKNIVQNAPEYAIAWTFPQRRALKRWHFLPVVGSPSPHDENTCLYRRKGSLPYAYTVDYQFLQAALIPLKAEQVQPLTVSQRLPDRIRLQVQSDAAEPLVVVVQELAYPGWQVKVNDELGKLESVGGFVGIVLPPGEEVYSLEFAYRPPLVYQGGRLTLLSCLFCILFLLRVDHGIKHLWRKYR